MSAVGTKAELAGGYWLVAAGCWLLVNFGLGARVAGVEDLAAELPAHVRCITVESVSTLWGSSPHGPEVWYQSVVIGGRRHEVVVSEADRGKAAHV